jgi:hypothetical protein
LLRLGEIVALPDLADEPHLTVPFADLSGEIDKLAMAPERNEIRDRDRHCG